MVDMSDERNYRSVLASAPPSDAAPDAKGSPTTVAPPDGDLIELVRVEVQPDPNKAGDMGAVELLERFSGRIGELGATVSEIAEGLRSGLESRMRSDRPGQWEMSQVMMEFGLNLEAETGMVIVKGKTAASFKVTITWAQRAHYAPP